jgi:uncharacterized protein (TIGR00645 family)
MSGSTEPGGQARPGARPASGTAPRLPAAPGGRRFLRSGVLAVHLLQLPLYLGLMLALVVFAVSFFNAIFAAVMTGAFLDRDGAILLLLDLLDMIFIANLAVMVMVSGHNAFVNATRLPADGESEIAYSDQFAPMKARIAATLVIISGIHVVHEVLAGDLAEPRELLVLGGLHLVLLAGAIAFAWIARWDRRAPDAEDGR